MAGYDKIWKKISEKPYRSDVRMNEIHNLLVNVGFELVRVNGSHRHYKHDLDASLLTIPCHSDTSCPLPAYVKMVYEKISALELID